MILTMGLNIKKYIFSKVKSFLPNFVNVSFFYVRNVEGFIHPHTALSIQLIYLFTLHANISADLPSVLLLKLTMKNSQNVCSNGQRMLLKP